MRKSLQLKIGVLEYGADKCFDTAMAEIPATKEVAVEQPGELGLHKMSLKGDRQLK